MSCFSYAHPYIDPATGFFKWVGEGGAAGDDVCEAIAEMAAGLRPPLRYHLELNVNPNWPAGVADVFYEVLGGTRGPLTVCQFVGTPINRYVYPNPPCDPNNPGPPGAGCVCDGCNVLIGPGHIQGAMLSMAAGPSGSFNREYLTIGNRIGPDPAGPALPPILEACRYVGYDVRDADFQHIGGGVFTGHDIIVTTVVAGAGICNDSFHIFPGATFPYTVQSGGGQPAQIPASIKAFDVAQQTFFGSCHLILDE